jgi:hypothetical protein
MDPFDVLDVGRMALVQDTTGAVLALWEARRHTGAGIIGETNAMCWNELATTDPRRAEAFYTGLFGWGSGARTAGDASYTTFMQDGAPRGGLLEIDASCGPVPPHWLVYFAVRDCDGQTALVQSLGGSVRVPPSGVSDVGRFAVVADPQGAAFAVIERSPASRRARGKFRAWTPSLRSGGGPRSAVSVRTRFPARPSRCCSSALCARRTTS